MNADRNSGPLTLIFLIIMLLYRITFEKDRDLLKCRD